LITNQALTWHNNIKWSSTL